MMPRGHRRFIRSFGRLLDSCADVDALLAVADALDETAREVQAHGRDPELFQILAGFARMRADDAAKGKLQ